jgi:SRSO17 transposase
MERWGLSLEAIEGLGERLKHFWRYYGQKTRTKTRNTSDYGVAYVSGLLRLEARRNMAHIGRQTGVSEQNMQHFMSESPWSGRATIEAMQEAVAQRGDWRGGILILDESGDEKYGDAAAGVAHQYNGRHKRVERAQVGVFLAYAQGTTWSWVDGELFLSEKWFSPAYTERRRKAEVPATRTFQQKAELGWQMIQRAQAAGIPFVAVTFDSLYGQDNGMRDQCQTAGLEYYADVKSTTQVYLRDPSEAFIPNSKGAVPNRPQILSQWAYPTQDIAEDDATLWQSVELRPDARGVLEADFAARPVWTLRDEGRVVAETLLLRRDGKHISYTLTNAALDTPLEVMAQRKSQRYFVERAIQDAKSELGWDEFQALKYRAWEHHLALTLLAAWFIAETRLDWMQDHPQDPALLQHYETDVLPALSVANVRELLRASLPLPQLSSAQAAILVVHHLDNRTRSRKSKLKRRFKP